MRSLYFHGGPGMNSAPETGLLQSKFLKAGMDLKLWHEPSALRPKGDAFKASEAYRNYLECAEEFFLKSCGGTPVLLIGHSFGAHPVCYLLKRYPDKIASAVLISSALSLSDADRNILGFMMRDFKEHQDLRHLKLQTVLDNYSGIFDANTQSGYLTAAESPRMLSYYWKNKERMGDFLTRYAAPEYRFDLDGFLRVRESFFDTEMEQSSVPTIAFFGKHDIVVSKTAEISLLKKRFRHLTVHEFEESAHYPHIEQTEHFLRILSQHLVVA